MKDSLFIVSEVDGLSEVAEYLLSLGSATPVILFNGEMGSGKTTLIKNICALAGVTDRVSSPTFSLVNEYLTEKGEGIFHFDLHRINEMEELLDFGFEDYVDSGNLCLIEWPAIAAPLLPEEVLMVQINEQDEVRHIRVSSAV